MALECDACISVRSAHCITLRSPTARGFTTNRHFDRKIGRFGKTGKNYEAFACAFNVRWEPLRKRNRNTDHVEESSIARICIRTRYSPQQAAVLTDSAETVW